MPERADALPLTEQEVKLLLANLEKFLGLKALIVLVLGTGMSLQDALVIRLQDFDYTHNILYVYDKGLMRKRCVKLNASVLKAVGAYQDGRYKPEEKLFPISEDTAINRLYQLSQSRLRRPISWMAIRHTWAVLGFKHGLGLKDMVESSGVSAQQLAVWSYWSKENGGKRDLPDMLAGLI